METIKVLLVEDHPELRAAFLSLLSREFQVVGTVDRGDLVLEAAERLLPDALVLDVSLPGRSGLQVLPELRARLPKMAIVMLTAHDEPMYRRAALRMGADAFLSKSSCAELPQAIRWSTEALRSA